MKLIFATHNAQKVAEVQSALPKGIEIMSLEEVGLLDDIPEPFNTLEENATEKSTVIFRQTKLNCFSEDAGLEVDALHGEPGVKSARYAGEERIPQKNIEKLLMKLGDEPNRSARFRAAISLILDEKEFMFEGICNGSITLSPRGNMGFGYDPIFIPDGSNLTFAEMTMDEKNKFSHRKKAVDKLVAFLRQYKKDG